MRPAFIKRAVRFPSRCRPIGTAASAVAAFCLLAAVRVAQADSFLRPKGAVAAEQRLHFWFVIGVMAFVVVPIFVILPFVLWRYRYGQRKSAYTPYWAKSKFWESVMWAGPTVIVVVLAFALWQETHRLDPYHWHPDAVNAPETTPSAVPPSDTVLGAVSDVADGFLLRHGAVATARELFAPMGPVAPASGAGGEPLEVRVVGYDWKWLFIYPKTGVARVNALVIPVGTPVHFVLTSDSVMQSFFIPALGSQIFAMYGMATHLNLEADRAGTYIGRNTQYNGEGFAQQHFSVTALPPAEFAGWMDGAGKGGRSWTPAIETALQKRGVVSDTPAYKDVPDAYFARVGHLSKGMH